MANDEERMYVDYILDKQQEDGTIQVKALAHNEVDSSHICEIHLDNQGHIEYGIVPDWDYNVDSYLLDDLENGFEIKYMPLEDHAVHWYCITWNTTRNRERGYDQGHYYNDYGRAFKDFKIRSHEMLEKHIHLQKERSKPKEKQHGER